MTIAFVSVLLNIHQIGIADELYKLSSGNFWFIETGIANEETKKGGEDFSSRPYLIRPFRSKNDREKTISIIRDVDVLIYGAAPLVFFKERVKTGKLTFQYGERWFKRGIINIISPRLSSFITLIAITNQFMHFAQVLMEQMIIRNYSHIKINAINGDILLL